MYITARNAIGSGFESESVIGKKNDVHCKEKPIPSTHCASKIAKKCIDFQQFIYSMTRSLVHFFDNQSLLFDYNESENYSPCLNVYTRKKTFDIIAIVT